MSRILIAELSAQLTAANEAMGAISDRRADLERRLQVARDERNDLRMPASMRGVVEVVGAWSLQTPPPPASIGRGRTCFTAN